MNELEKTEAQLKEIDRQMATLFALRMKAVREMAQAQKAKGLPLHEPTNLQSMLEEHQSVIEDEELSSYYPLFVRNLMGLSSQVGHRIMEGVRVGYAGVPGAFAEGAARKIFPDGKVLSYLDFREAYEAVEAGECDCAVLPLENSYAGDVAQVMDLAYFGSLYITGVYDVRICQCLLGTPDSTIGDVGEVISHPQALSQCAEYLKLHGFLSSEASNTAVAARRVAEEGNPAIAAIGSPEAAQLYGLKILESGINESSTNTTRFAVFSRTPHISSANDSQFIMTFTVKNEAGSLARTLSILGENGFNMRSLKSRPTKKLIWNNFFYLEAEGCLASPEGENMINQLKKFCSGLKVLGSFDKETAL